MEQYKYTPEEWEEQVREWWSQQNSMTREEAMMEYLKAAEDLEMYGVNVRSATERFRHLKTFAVFRHQKQERHRFVLGR